MPSSPSNGFINPTRNLTLFPKEISGLDLKKIEAEVVSACRLTFLLVEGGDHLLFWVIPLRGGAGVAAGRCWS
jgi:hypothetical protein